MSEAFYLTIIYVVKEKDKFFVFHPAEEIKCLFKDNDGELIGGFSFFKNPPLIRSNKLILRWNKELILTQDDLKNLEKSLEKLRERAVEIYDEFSEGIKIKENKKEKERMKNEKESFKKRLPSTKKQVLELKRRAGLIK